MRILLAIHNAYTDPASGAAHSMRILMQWLRDGGHDCRVLSSARFDGKPPRDLDAHLAQLNVSLRRSPAPKAFVRSVPKPANMMVGRPTVDLILKGVPVSVLLTQGKPGSQAEHLEGQQFLWHLDSVLREFEPDVLVSYGGHAVVQETMRRARASGAICVFTLRNFGYDDRRYFQHVDEVFTTSPYLSDMYRQSIGLRSAGIESPIDWSEVEAPVDLRRFVTFVNPSLAKGALLFARLADMLGARRPDIPLLVVQSATGAGALNEIPGLDFRKYPQIMAAPATRQPSDFFALTRILLVPSAGRESFGRVAAEALINAIPPLVSDRGALPQTVRDAGRVIPLPTWMTETTTDLPTAGETEPWFDAICELWDNAEAYERASQRARTTAERWFSEPVMRQRYLDYFSSLNRGRTLFEEG